MFIKEGVKNLNKFVNENLFLVLTFVIVYIIWSGRVSVEMFRGTDQSWFWPLSMFLNHTQESCESGDLEWDSETGTCYAKPTLEQLQSRCKELGMENNTCIQEDLDALKTAVDQLEASCTGADGFPSLENCNQETVDAVKASIAIEKLKQDCVSMGLEETCLAEDIANLQKKCDELGVKSCTKESHKAAELTAAASKLSSNCEKLGLENTCLQSDIDSLLKECAKYPHIDKCTKSVLELSQKLQKDCLDHGLPKGCLRTELDNLQSECSKYHVENCTLSNVEEAKPHCVTIVDGVLSSTKLFKVKNTSSKSWTVKFDFKLKSKSGGVIISNNSLSVMTSLFGSTSTTRDVKLRIINKQTAGMNANMVANKVLSLNQWYSVTVVASGSNIQIYIDGALVTNYGLNKHPASINGDMRIVLANHVDIKDVKWCNYSLPASEI